MKTVFHSLVSKGTLIHFILFTQLNRHHFMRKIYPFIFILFSFISLATNAQKVTLSGTFRDAASGESLIGALIRTSDLKNGARSNEYGFYSITLPVGNYTFLISNAGYETDTIVIHLTANEERNWSMNQKTSKVKEVKVTATRKNEKVVTAQMGSEKLEIKEVNKIPVIFGEKDIIKTLQLLPGIKSSGEGQSGINVRGGTSDQNLILLDEALVYSASHLLGFFSTFNSDAIKDLTVFKGTAPAQYGGKLSSVLDIRMKEGNKKTYEVNGSIGLISSKLSVEGPLVKDKSSFIIAGRRTYADLFLALAPDSAIRNNKLYFYDLNLKMNYRFGKKDALYLSGYFGRDVLGFGDVFGINWGNATGTLRWNHLFNDKLFSNLSAIYSNYDYKIGIKSGKTDFEILSRIQDFNLKQEFQYFPDSRNSWKFGANIIFHNIIPGQVNSADLSTVNNLALENRYSFENALFLSDDWKVSERLNLQLGMRVSMFHVLGRGSFSTLDPNADLTNVDPNSLILSTTTYGTLENVKTYVNQEPRVSASYLFNESNSVKFGYSRNTQHLHLLSNSNSGNPTDKWIPNNNNIKPEIADQISVGYFKNLKNNTIEINVETYYKWMQNQLDYKNSANVFLFTNAIETQLLSGIGRAYGIELLIRKNTGKLTGWIGYTLSKTERKIEGINNNNWYNATQDKTHDLSIVGIYQVGPKINVSGTFVYSTGRATTYPVGFYTQKGLITYDYTNRNQDRFPSNHRLDLGANFIIKEKKKYISEISVSIYNVYGRQNPFSIAFEANATNPSKIDAVQTSLFRQVPSISWNFKFK